MTEEATIAAVYVDANPFIYFIDGEESAANRPRPFFEMLRRKPRVAMTSELTLAEVLPKARPYARRNYLNLIVWSGLFDLRPVTREILIDTADYRRSYLTALPDGRSVMPTLPDAIHVVTAARNQCQIFLSADRRVKLPAGITVCEPDEPGLARLLRELA
jgi:predicted nucleic acid-binding protein